MEARYGTHTSHESHKTFKLLDNYSIVAAELNIACYSIAWTGQKMQQGLPFPCESLQSQHTLQYKLNTVQSTYSVSQSLTDACCTEVRYKVC